MSSRGGRPRWKRPGIRAGSYCGVASLTTMSDLERRGGSRLTRKQREQRAYRLVLATGAFGLAGTAGLILAIVGIIGAGLPILALIIAAICFMMFRRTVR